MDAIIKGRGLKLSDPVKGALYATISMIMFAVMNAGAKHLAGRHDVFEIAFYRNMIGTIMFGVYFFIVAKTPLPKLNNKSLIFSRSALGFISLILTFKAFQLLPMANTQVLLFASSLLLPVLAFFWLKEHVGPWRWCAVASGFIGVMLIAGPSAGMSTLGVIVALCAATLHAVIGVMLRHLGRSDSPAIITYYFLLVGLVFSAPFFPFAATPVSPHDALVILAIGVAGSLAQLFLSCGYAHLQASVMAILGYTNLIWAALMGWMVWGDWPTSQVWMGASIVIASNIVIIVREHLHHIRRSEDIGE